MRPVTAFLPQSGGRRSGRRRRCRRGSRVPVEHCEVSGRHSCHLTAHFIAGLGPAPPSPSASLDAMLTWLQRNSLTFPPLEKAMRDPNGLLAAGGDLSADRLVQAYRHGCFPWFSEGQPILWWSPDPRTVLFPDELHVSRSLGKLLRKQRYQVTFDRDFAAVIRACAAPGTTPTAPGSPKPCKTPTSNCTAAASPTRSRSGMRDNWSAACMAWRWVSCFW